MMNRITINTDVDFDLDEIYNDLDNDDKEDLVKWLKEDEFIEESEIISASVSMMEITFRENLKKLHENYSRLTSEQIEYIEKISKFL